MGAAASVLNRKKDVMSVDPVPNRRTKVFAKQIFRRYEWIVLKTFCQRYKISQKDLIRIFEKYLSHEEVYLRDFRVRTDDIKVLFLHQSKLQKVVSQFIYTELSTRMHANMGGCVCVFRKLWMSSFQPSTWPTSKDWSWWPHPKRSPSRGSSFYLISSVVNKFRTSFISSSLYSNRSSTSRLAP